MSEKIYARLLRLYPSRFRKEYEADALQLIRDRLRDERGLFKRARLWWDLVTDVFVGLPSAYQNSYAVIESVSCSFSAAGIPSFKILDEEPLGRGSILIGSAISLIVLVAFVLLLGRPIAFRPLSGSNGRLSPIEAVMQRLNQPPAPDAVSSSLPDTSTPGSSQMIASQSQSSMPGASIPNADRKRVVSAQMQIGDKQTAVGANRQEFAKGPIADVRNSSHDSQTVVKQSPRYSGTIAKLTATVTLSYLPANPVAGSMVNLTATVLAVGTGPTPTGSVRFFDGNAVLKIGKLNNGTVTVQEKLPYNATHSLSAIYDGDTSYSSARSIGKRD
jgi:hypothetical protein